VSRRVQITSGRSLQAVIDELKRLGGPPGFKVVGSLEAALAVAFADTQAKTHVITGSLKASGKTETDFDSQGNWTGAISYGGASAGPNNPVDYAIYEMARGGEHDFFRDLPKYYESFDHAIDRHFTDI
jgi:hypothetical protein